MNNMNSVFVNYTQGWLSFVRVRSSTTTSPSLNQHESVPQPVSRRYAGDEVVIAALNF